jgi:hypothetical protein
MSEEEETIEWRPLVRPGQLTGWEDVIFELEDEPEETPWASE